MHACCSHVFFSNFFTTRCLRRYLFGMTQKHMDFLRKTLLWEDSAGNRVFKPHEMVSHKLLPELTKQLPLLTMYIRRVTTEVKGITSTALMGQHAVEDVLVRLLQMTPLEEFVFRARDGNYTKQFRTYNKNKPAH